MDPGIAPTLPRNPHPKSYSQRRSAPAPSVARQESLPQNDNDWEAEWKQELCPGPHRTPAARSTTDAVRPRSKAGLGSYLGRHQFPASDLTSICETCSDISVSLLTAHLGGAPQVGRVPRPRFHRICNENTQFFPSLHSIPSKGSRAFLPAG